MYVFSRSCSQTDVAPEARRGLCLAAFEREGGAETGLGSDEPQVLDRGDLTERDLLGDLGERAHLEWQILWRVQGVAPDAAARDGEAGEHGALDGA